MNSTNSHTKRIIAIITCAIAALALIIALAITLANHRKIDTLDGFWETRGSEHYVAYIHGDTIDIFWFEDSEESAVAKWTPGFRISGHFTPPQPGFNTYEFDLTYDYNRSNAQVSTWSAAEALSFQTDPMTFRFEYKNGKLIRHYDLGETDTFYPSSRDHYEADMQAAILDMQYEISQLALPLELGTITTVPAKEDAEETFPDLLFVEVTNPNIFRINRPSLLLYGDEETSNPTECVLGTTIEPVSHVVLVAPLPERADINSTRRDLLYNEYAIAVPENGNKSPIELLETIAYPGLHAYFKCIDATIRVDLENAEPTYKAAVVFYKDGVIEGGGYTYFSPDSTDMTVTIPIMTAVTSYDWYEIYFY